MAASYFSLSLAAITLNAGIDCQQVLNSHHDSNEDAASDDDDEEEEEEEDGEEMPP